MCNWKGFYSSNVAIHVQQLNIGLGKGTRTHLAHDSNSAPHIFPNWAKKTQTIIPIDLSLSHQLHEFTLSSGSVPFDTNKNHIGIIPIFSYAYPIVQCSAYNIICTNTCIESWRIVAHSVRTPNTAHNISKRERITPNRRRIVWHVSQSLYVALVWRTCCRTHRERVDFCDFPASCIFVGRSLQSYGRKVIRKNRFLIET